MAEIVFFHHVLGVTPGIVALADALRGGGHTVHVPDLYAGRTFADLANGLAFAESTGFGELIERGTRAVDDVPHDIVYAGYSLGVLPAQKLAQTRPGASGALFVAGCVPVAAFESPWPDGVPVEMHAMDADPIFVGEGDVDAARALVASTARARLHLYPGDRHFFADASHPEYDADATALLIRRALSFLAAMPNVQSRRC